MCTFLGRGFGNLLAHALHTHTLKLREREEIDNSRAAPFILLSSKPHDFLLLAPFQKPNSNFKTPFDQINESEAATTGCLYKHTHTLYREKGGKNPAERL